MQTLNNTAHKLLDVAEKFTQQQGFNGFSYKDLQREVGVKTSSIHYYFPTKQDLARHLTERYIERFRQALETVTATHPQGKERLQALGDLYAQTVNDGSFCLCGMLASEMYSLSAEVNTCLHHFFDIVEQWIAVAIEAGKVQGDFKPTINSQRAACQFLSTLEGGMLIARQRQKPQYLRDVVACALTQMAQDAS